LKKLFQEWRIPPWERAVIPLIYVGDELAQVLGYCCSETFAALENEPSWLIE
jgi:tRNA(Ile)-lysidine synthase